jgi:hypothetical protein
MTAFRRLVTLVALLAFFLQGLAIQTHIHQQSPLSVAGIQASTLPAPSPLKTLDSADPANCRLCQELVHAGALVQPVVTTLAVTLSVLPAFLAVTPQPAAHMAPAFAWQGRAPPRR